MSNRQHNQSMSSENTENAELQRRLHDAHESSAMLRSKIEELQRLPHVSQESLRMDIERAINCHSADGSSDTPDHILATYLMDCLAAFDKATLARKKYKRAE